MSWWYTLYATVLATTCLYGGWRLGLNAGYWWGYRVGTKDKRQLPDLRDALWKAGTH